MDGFQGDDPAERLRTRVAQCFAGKYSGSCGYAHHRDKPAMRKFATLNVSSVIAGSARDMRCMSAPAHRAWRSTAGFGSLRPSPHVGLRSEASASRPSTRLYISGPRAIRDWWQLGRRQPRPLVGVLRHHDEWLDRIIDLQGSVDGNRA